METGKTKKTSIGSVPGRDARWTLYSQQEMAAKPAGLSRAPILTNSYYSRQRSYRHDFSKNLTLTT